MDGCAIGSIICDDVRRLLHFKGNANWLGCIEWRVTGAGKVTVDASSRGDAQRLNSGRPVIQVDGVAAAAGADEEGPLFMIYVRLEPGVYHGPELGVKHRVLNINNVGLAEPFRERGVFTSLLGVLEAWMRDEGDASRPRAIMVQNVCNARLMAWLKNRPGWATFPGEEHSIMTMVA